MCTNDSAVCKWFTVHGTQTKVSETKTSINRASSWHLHSIYNMLLLPGRTCFM